MAKRISPRRILLGLLTGLSLTVAGISAPIVTGGGTPAYAQVSAEFQAALEPYGEWRRHPRWGEVWVPDDRPRDWRPYTYGHWVYTDEWGWYWASDDEEADWGWVTYHYGRWAHDRQLGWFWIPGDEWAPAWVDWRRGGDYLGWAPLPPDDVIVEYEDNPFYWIFVQPRYLLAPRMRTFILPPQRTVVVIRQTVVVNRTVRLEHMRSRIAVNPGIAPNIVAAAARNPVPIFRVQPRVIAGTQGVIGAVQVRPQDLSRRGQVRTRGPAPVQATIQRTTTVIQPAPSVPTAQPLGKTERGRLGSHPPRAAQGGTVPPPTPVQQQAPIQQQAPAPTPVPTQQTPVQQQKTPVQQQTPAATQPPRAPLAPRPGGAPATMSQPPAPPASGPPSQAKPAGPITPQTPPPAAAKPAAPPVPPAARPAAPAAPHPPAPPAVRSPPPPAAHPPAPPAARQAPPPAARPAPPAAGPAPPSAVRPAPPKPGDKKPEEPK